MIKSVIAGLLVAMLTVAGTAQAQQQSAAQTPSAGASVGVDDYAQTRYPIVLVPGLAGTGASVGGVNYFYGIPADLASHGAQVFVANLSAFQTDAGANGRGEQLVAYIETVLAATGAAKVNLIGHSQGGLTARYAAAVAPDLVASVTTVGTPHWGSQLADAVQAGLQADPTGMLPRTVTLLLNAFGALEGGIANQNAATALQGLTTASMAQFNQQYPSAGLPPSLAACRSGKPVETVNGSIHLLYSWSGEAIRAGTAVGRTTLTSTDTSIASLFDPELYFNPVTFLLNATGVAMLNFGSGSNDGMTAVCSAGYGYVVGSSFNWNHLDEINQPLGMLGGNAEDPVAMFRNHANRLKLAGV